MSATLLRCTCLSKKFGGVQAVADVSYQVAAAQRFAIIGPNGAGKTTLLNLTSGLIKPDRGEVELLGRQVVGRPAWRRASDGMARTLQTPVVYQDLTVRENAMLGHVAKQRVSFIAAILGLPALRQWNRAAEEKAMDALSLLGIAPLAERRAGELSLGNQRLVEIARAMVTEPKVMLLDEPAAGLAASEVDRLIDALREVNSRGIAVCVVEHNMRLVMSLAERILVLHHGKALFEGTPSEVQMHPEVIAAYLGGSKSRAQNIADAQGASHAAN